MFYSLADKMYKQYRLEVESNVGSVPSTPKPAVPPPTEQPLRRQRSILRRERTKADEDWQPLQRHKSTAARDVMISYSHQNKDSMRRLRGESVVTHA